MDREKCGVPKKWAFFGLPPYRMASLNPQNSPIQDQFTTFFAPPFLPMARVSPREYVWGVSPGEYFWSVSPGEYF